MYSELSTASLSIPFYYSDFRSFTKSETNGQTTGFWRS